MTDSIAKGPSPRPIDHADDLRAAVAELVTAPRIGLDVEGDGFYRYRARLCTMQLAAGARVALIDALAIDDLSPLATLLGANGPVKIIHDASFDARILLRRGLVLDRVFDTAVAARFLGESATGLSTLLARHLGVALDKDQQQADWGARPLSAERIEYLVADVQHLLPLAAILSAALTEVDLLEEVEEESRYVLARAREPEPEREPISRIKGARELSPDKRALLRALCEVREQIAEERDVPPFRVAPNAALFEAARRGLREPGELSRVRGMRGLGADALARAIELSETDIDEESERPPPMEERARRRARERELSTWRRAEAERRGVDPQAILPGHCLRDLARLDAASVEDLSRVEGLGRKRVVRYGAEWMRILEQ